jgi:branched-chain amino acid transport system ATP-binding protein
VTILLVEHVLQAVMRLSDRVLVLVGGRLAAAGTPAEIVRDPAVIEAYLGEGVDRLVATESARARGA